MFKFTSQANHMQKLLQLKKDYEREGFHLQRLYKRRKKDENGIMRSTFGQLREPMQYNTATSVFKNANEEINLKIYTIIDGGSSSSWDQGGD